MPTRSSLAPLLALVVLSACSGSGFDQPKASAFRAGSCRSVAPSVLALGKDLHGLGTKAPSSKQKSALKDHQRALRDQQPGVEPSLAPTVAKLVTAVGIVRLRADTDSWDSALADTAMQAYQGVVRTCTDG